MPRTPSPAFNIMRGKLEPAVIEEVVETALVLSNKGIIDCGTFSPLEISGTFIINGPFANALSKAERYSDRDIEINESTFVIETLLTANRYITRHQVYRQFYTNRFSPTRELNLSKKLDLTDEVHTKLRFSALGSLILPFSLAETEVDGYTLQARYDNTFIEAETGRFNPERGDYTIYDQFTVTEM